MLPDYEKYMRELRCVRSRQSGTTLEPEIKPLRLDLQGWPLERELQDQSHGPKHP